MRTFAIPHVFCLDCKFELHFTIEENGVLLRHQQNKDCKESGQSIFLCFDEMEIISFEELEIKCK